jgi:hypothetical protein
LADCHRRVGARHAGSWPTGTPKCLEQVGYVRISKEGEWGCAQLTAWNLFCCIFFTDLLFMTHSTDCSHSTSARHVVISVRLLRLFALRTAHRLCADLTRIASWYAASIRANLPSCAYVARNKIFLWDFLHSHSAFIRHSQWVTKKE